MHSVLVVAGAALLAVAGVTGAPAATPAYPPLPRAASSASSALSSLSGAPYNILRSYVLGLSSGGFLAVQMSVAYSSEFSGAGIFAAGPYYCAQGQLTTAVEQCMNAAMPIDLNSLDETIVGLSLEGLIDGLGNLTAMPVYLFHGTSDEVVLQPVNEALYQQYVAFGTNVLYNNKTEANHAWISPTGPNPCTAKESPYISNCDIDPEAELLGHILQRIPTPPTVGAPTGNVYSFSQDEYAQALFNTNAGTYSMDSTGYVYLPLSCAAGTPCDLLVVLHGCQQGYATVNNVLITDSNLNVYADTNNMIVLYPQAIDDVTLENPSGCWDWWGYSTSGSSTLYATHGAPQMEIIRGIMKGLGFKGKPLAAKVPAASATRADAIAEF